MLNIFNAINTTPFFPGILAGVTVDSMNMLSSMLRRKREVNSVLLHCL